MNDGESLHLVPEIAQYLRKLFHQNLDQLISTHPGEAEAKIRLFKDFEGEIAQRYPDKFRLQAAFQALDQLALSHQALSNQSLKQQQLQQIEQEIFAWFGYQRQQPAHKATILVVDDVPENLRLLSAALTRQNYEVCSAINGPLALSTVKEIQPDLILLDVMMPGMDGYEVCAQLKADGATQAIPVLFISAADTALDKVRAFNMGGVDYITKPFQIEEVLARIEHQLKLRELQKRLEEQNICLQKQIYESQQTEKRYRSIFENAIDGIFQATPDGKYLNVNLALARLYGYDSPAELITTVTDIARQLYVKPERRAEFMAYIRLYSTVSDFESEIYRKDGTTIWIAEDVRSVKGVDGNLLFYEGTVKEITDRKQTEAELRRERLKTERLLLNTLPQRIAERLKKGPTIIADHFEQVTVLFADIVDFTALSAKTSPIELISLLNQIFSAFDQLVDRYGLEKIKTIGDAYMAVGGLPNHRPDHAEAIADMALNMQEIIPQFQGVADQPFQLRIGVNTGPVIAGVIGKKKFSYDLWGDTVNIASRMESEGLAGKIQVTAATYERLKKHYHLQERGFVSVKGRGEMMTYWLLSRRDDLVATTL